MTVLLSKRNVLRFRLRRLTGSLLILAFLLFTQTEQLFAQISVSGGTGLSATYPSLTNTGGLFAALNATAQTGNNIVVSITADVTTEAGTVELNAGAWASISITPSGARTISGSAAGKPLIGLNGADFVTINGLNTGGNSLIISNTSTSSTSGTSTIRFQTDAVSNVITNCSILGANTTALATNGGNIIFGAGSSTTGNDGNTISFCDIGPVGTSLPSKCLHFGGSSNTDPGTANSGNIITNNNIFDYFLAGSPSAGIYVASGTTNFGITNNKFYQTATRTQTTGAIHSAIRINNGSGNNYQITGNTFGYNSSAGTGNYNLVGVSSTQFIPVYLESVGTTTATGVNGNTFANITMSGTLSGTTTTAYFVGVYVGSGLASVGGSTGNTFGSQTATGSLAFTSSTSSAGDVFLYFNNGSSSSIFSNNIIGGISMANSSSGTAIFGAFYGNTSTTATSQVTNNTIGGTIANSISVSATSSSSQVVGIRNSSSSFAPILTATGNIIRNLTNSAGNTSTGTAASVIGILHTNSSTTGNTISQNQIYNLSNTHATAATSVNGISYSGTTGTNVIERNFIYGLDAVSATAIINGIAAIGGTTVYKNNMIRLGTATNSSVTGMAVNGMNETGGTNSFYFNSVYIGGSPATGSANSFAFTSTVTSTTRAYQNNIFFNARSNNGATGKHYAIRTGGTTTPITGLTSNYNILYVNGTGGFVGLWNSVDRPDLSAWKTATLQDANSVSADPQFITPAGAVPDLHISTVNPTPAEGAGLAIGSVTNDYDNDTRASFTPTDIGADAGNFVSAPPMVYVSNTVTQQTGSVCAGTSNVAVLRIEIVTSGIISPLTLTNMVINANGTSAFTDISSYRIYSTGSSPVFSSSNPISASATGITATDVTVTPSATVNLGTGSNNFWIVYNLPATATGPTIDAEVTSITLSSGAITPSSTAPAGNITVNPKPVVTLTSSSATYCNPGGTAVVLTASGASTYTYSPTTGLTPTTGSPVSAAPTSNTTYTVTGTDVNGCTNTATSAITVLGGVTGLAATATPSTICAGATVALNATVTNVKSVKTYTFNTSTGATLDPMASATNVVGPGVDDAPMALTGTSAGSGQAIGFNFPYENVNYTFFSASPDGWIKLANTSAAATSDFSNVMTSADNLPLICPLWDDAVCGSDGSVKMQVNGTAPNRILILQWTVVIPRVASPGASNSVYQAWLYETSGLIEFRYGTVAAPASATCGLIGATNSNYHSVTFSSNTASTSSANDANAVAPASGRMYSFTPVGENYSWSPAALVVNPTSQSSQTNAISATQQFTVTATNQAGCTATTSTTVTVSDGAAITTSPTSLTRCEGTSATFTVAATGVGLTYQWRKNTVDIPVATNASAGTASLVLNGVTMADGASYDVVVTASCGLPVTSSAAVLTVNPAPAVAVSPSTGLICSPGGSAVTLTASGATSYSWSPTTGLTPSTGDIVSALPTGTTTYTVTGTGANGCTKTASSVITVGNAVQNLTATATPAYICNNSSTTLNATSNAVLSAKNYVFSTSTGTTLNPMVGATTVVASGIDDAPMSLSGTTAGAAQPIGFTFNFEGQPFTHYSASPDGWVRFTNSTTAISSDISNDLNSGSNVPKICPLWDDIATGTTGNVQTLVTGTAPNRIFIVQWFVTIPRNTGGAANSTFQAWMYETTGVVEFRYGTMSASASGASVGIAGTGTSNFLSVTPSTNSVSSATASNSLTVIPTSGRLYTFTPPALSYSWSPAAFVTSPNTQSTPTTSLSANQTYTVVATTSAGCSASANTTVNVFDTVQIVTQPVAISRCIATTATFSVSANGAGLTYQWRKDGVDIPVASNASATTATLSLSNVALSDAALYDVVITSSCGITKTSNAAQLTVNVLPTVAITPNTGLICNPGGTAVSLTASGASTYAWTPSGSLSAATGTTVSANPTTTTSYTVTGTDANGCTSTGTASITVSQAVQNLTATANPASICAGLTTTLSANANVAFTANNYIFSTSNEAELDAMTSATQLLGSGQANTVTSATAIGFSFPFEGTPYTHFAVTPDGFLVFGGSSLSISTQTTNTTTSSTNVPKIYPFWDNIHTGAAGSVKYLVTGTAPNRILKVQWAVNLQNNSTGAVDGTFQAWLYETSGVIEFRYGSMAVPAGTVSAGLTGATATNYQSITFSGNTVSNSTANDGNTQSPSAGRMYTFTPPALITYSWSPAGMVVSPSSATTATQVLNTQQVFTITASTAIGCTATANLTVVVGDSVRITSQPVNQAVCNGSALNLSVVATGVGLTYQWQKGGVDISTAGNPSAGTANLIITPASLSDAGNYSVVVTGTCGVPATSNTVTVNVNTLPSVSLNSSADIFCSPGGTAVTLNASGASTYTYNPVTGLTPSSGATVSASPTTTTTYTVTGTDANGCTGTATKTISVLPAPTGLVASATPSAVCNGSTSQLDVNIASIPGSESIRITEITLNRTGTGATASYPAYATGADLVEISNISASSVDISNWTLSDYPSASATSTHSITFPAGTILPSHGVAVICLGTGSDDLPNFYFNTGGTSDFYSSTGSLGVVLKNGSTVIDAVGVSSGYTFASGTGVTSASWSGGFAPVATGFAGTIRTAAYDSNSGGDWIQAGSTLQTIGTYNGGYNPPVSIASYSWTPNTFMTGSSAIKNPALANITANTTYTVTVTTSAGCAVSGSVPVTVQPSITIDATSAVPAVCSGDSVQLNVALTSGVVPQETSFSSTASLTIPSSGNATPYPSSIAVSGIPANSTVKKVSVSGFSHNWPEDVDMVLVSPTGQAVTLMSDVGGSNTATNLNLVFQDGSPALTSSAFTSGTYAPTNLDLTDNYPAPGPGSVTTNLPLSAFTGNPNGTWSLFVLDDATIVAGSISGGFSITFNTPSAPVYTWSPAGLFNNTSSASPKARVNSPTTFYVSALNPSTGCTVVDSVVVNTIARPKPVITPGDTVLCSGDVIKLAVRDTGAYSGGYPAGTVVDWINIVNGLTPADSIESDNGTVYQARVTLSGGCSATSSVRNVLTRSVTTSFTNVFPSCGAANGSITTTVTSGVSPFRFLYKQGATVIKDTTVSAMNHTITGLAPGNYTLEITDSFPYGCSSGIINYTLPLTTPPSVTINETTPVSCAGENNGVLQAVAINGHGPLTYLWNTGATSIILNNASAGNYSVIVTDDLGCADTATYTLSDPAPVVANISSTSPVCYGGSDGSISATLSGGFSPYEVEWYYNDPVNGDVLVGNTPSVTGLTAGDYTLYVLDDHGCISSFNHTIAAPAQLVINSYTPSNGNSGTVVTISGSGFTGITAVKFNGVDAIYTVVSPTSISVTVPATATTGFISVHTASCTATSSTAFTINPTTISLNLKLFLQGYYVGGQTMNAALYNQGVSMDPTDCDSITVEIRDAVNPHDPPVAVRTVLIKTDGTGSLTLPSTLSGNSYYVVIKHRNSVETWSKNPVLFGSVTSLDFVH